MNTYQQFCENVTTQLFNVIEEKGSLLTWKKGWDDSFSSQLPLGVSGLYSGSNIFSLLIEQEKQRLPSNEWLTMRQVNKLGGKVNKGAKAQKVYFWKLQETKEKEADDTKKIIPLFKSYSVFNIDQTTLESLPVCTKPLIETVEALLEKHNVSVSHFGGHAYYSSSSADVIVLPKRHRFASEENYYATLLHELTHWTGHPSRLNRPTLVNYHTDRAIRAEEELVAEIGALLLTTHFGINGEIENHASYVDSWKTLLTEKQVMNATAKAAKAFSWLVNDKSDTKEVK